MKARNVEIEATILFADLRGYTAASQVLASDQMTTILDTFYDECADAIWQHDGLLNKTIGDAVMAIFNFPIRQHDHAAKAVRAALGMQRSWRVRRKELLAKGVIDENDLHVGIGISGGIVKFGEFGQSHRDLTAIGSCEYRYSSTNCSQRRPDFGDSYCSVSKQRGERHRLWRSKEIPFEGISKSRRPI